MSEKETNGSEVLKSMKEFLERHPDLAHERVIWGVFGGRPAIIGYIDKNGNTHYKGDKRPVNDTSKEST